MPAIRAPRYAATPLRITGNSRLFNSILFSISLAFDLRHAIPGRRFPGHSHARAMRHSTAIASGFTPFIALRRRGVPLFSVYIIRRCCCIYSRHLIFIAIPRAQARRLAICRSHAFINSRLFHLPRFRHYYSLLLFALLFVYSFTAPLIRQFILLRHPGIYLRELLLIY